MCVCGVNVCVVCVVCVREYFAFMTCRPDWVALSSPLPFSGSGRVTQGTGREGEDSERKRKREGETCDTKLVVALEAFHFLRVM